MPLGSGISKTVGDTQIPGGRIVQPQWPTVSASPQQMSFLKLFSPWPFRSHLTEKVLDSDVYSWKGTYSQTKASGGFKFDLLTITSRLNCPQWTVKSWLLSLPVLQAPPGMRDPAGLFSESHIFKSNKAQQLESNCQFFWWGSRKLRKDFRAYSCVGLNKCELEQKAVAAHLRQRSGPRLGGKEHLK